MHSLLSSGKEKGAECGRQHMNQTTGSGLSVYAPALRDEAQNSVTFLKEISEEEEEDFEKGRGLLKWAGN